jgi:UV DNA damage endonuclease
MRREIPVPADSSRDAIRPRLGLVCITVSNEVRFRTITRTRLLAQPPRLRRKTLATLYAEYCERLEGAFAFCGAQRIGLYRLTSGLFPFSDDPLGEPVLRKLAPRLSRIGRAAAAARLRLVVHPDQFVVLSSESGAVVENSVRMLAGQALALDLLEQPRSPWAAIEIHCGKSGRGDALLEVVRSLPDPIRTRLVLENDERCYGAEEVLRICRHGGIPMVFDAHHHLVHDRLATYGDPSMDVYMRAASGTWPDPAWQLVHISNGRGSLGDPRHADLVTRLPRCFRSAPWIEVEAKMKEEAIARLGRLLRATRKSGAPRHRRRETATVRPRKG